MKKEEKILSKKEKLRLEKFEKTSEELKQQKFVRKDLTININKATIISLAVMLLFFVLGAVLYFLVNRRFDFSGFNGFVFLIGYIVLIVAHELIHGACWLSFAPGRFKDVEFGIMKPSFSPYCTCLAPLKKWQYLIGAMMPGLLLGVIPFVVSIMTAHPLALLMSVTMIASATGDMMIMAKVIGYKSSAKEIMYMDHPTDAGGVIFER